MFLSSPFPISAPHRHAAWLLRNSSDTCKEYSKIKSWSWQPLLASVASLPQLHFYPVKDLFLVVSKKILPWVPSLGHFEESFPQPVSALPCTDPHWRGWDSTRTVKSLHLWTPYNLCSQLPSLLGIPATLFPLPETSGLRMNLFCAAVWKLSSGSNNTYSLGVLTGIVLSIN